VENHIHSTEESVVLLLSVEKCSEIMKCFLYFKVYEYTLIAHIILPHMSHNQ